MTTISTYTKENGDYVIENKTRINDDPALFKYARTTHQADGAILTESITESVNEVNEVVQNVLTILIINSDGNVTVVSNSDNDIQLSNTKHGNQFLVGGDGNIVLQVAAGKRVKVMGDLEVTGNVYALSFQ